MVGFEEMWRVLGELGRWVTVSLAQPHLLAAWSDFLSRQSSPPCLARVLQVPSLV